MGYSLWYYLILSALLDCLVVIMCVCVPSSGLDHPRLSGGKLPGESGVKREGQDQLLNGLSGRHYTHTHTQTLYSYWL